ncbi:hypothetical protein FB472_0506 [Rhodoglobus vestalii]|uniref:Protoporphyrinogen oxidase n=1 Tax=Rhodoglobus vestalii TaxID=193384 RepID=A0A8H2K4U3_9MICO|nr:protoporphyrinogen oxidase [Rhodoglobus vestalii]TQO18974.1 hypothetical protein FB472_0506 [Rhodoglobus vestalii]
MNVRLFVLGIGIAIGYVVGAREGRERYDQMKSTVTKFWESARVAKARVNVEDYARTQGPVLRDRAEAVAKATPGFVAHTAKDVAESVRDVAESATESAKEFVDRASASARDVVGRVTHTATDVRDNATKTAAELRERGESAIDRAVTTAGKARDEALAPLDDDDDEQSAK